MRLGQENIRLDTDVAFPQPKAPLNPLEARVDSNLLKKKWIPGTEPQVTENQLETGKLLLFRDSFSINLIPYLGQRFNRVVYIWQHNWDKVLIEQEMPDIVIDEMLERFVLSRSPTELKEADDKLDVQIFGD